MICHKNFYFIRHGQTDWNKKNIAMGQKDIPLNEKGLEQARGAAVLLKNVCFRLIVASPLKRAKKTAEIIAASCKKSTVFLDEFKEARWGVRQGMDNGDDAWLRAWRRGEFVIEGAETFLEMQQRVKVGLEKALGFDGPVLIVAHGGVYWALRAILGVPFEDTHNCLPYFFRAPTDPGGPNQPWFVCEVL